MDLGMAVEGTRDVKGEEPEWPREKKRGGYVWSRLAKILCD